MIEPIDETTDELPIVEMGTRQVVPNGMGIPVGPNPEPTKPEPMALYVEMTLSGGTTQTQMFEIPAGSHVTRMQLSAMRGKKDLGPIVVMPLAYHDDSRVLHTICRQGSTDIETIEL